MLLRAVMSELYIQKWLMNSEQKQIRTARFKLTTNLQN